MSFSPEYCMDPNTGQIVNGPCAPGQEPVVLGPLTTEMTPLPTPTDHRTIGEIDEILQLTRELDAPTAAVTSPWLYVSVCLAVLLVAVTVLLIRKARA